MNSGKAGALVCFLWVVQLWSGAQIAPSALPRGQVIESVTCASDSSESYAAYLPSNYTATRQWPIIYFFDPLARGRVPVKLYKDLAEKYGYILVASNTSRNFSLESSSRGANATWQDTHLRLSLDPSRIYTSGFSGGARVAGMVAGSCQPCRIAGVIAFGAGYPSPGRSPDSLLYFFGVGDQDFNWPEVIGIRHEREEAGQPYRVRVFPGPHQWGTTAVMEDALEWMQLKAMQAGTIPADATFLDRRLKSLQADAAEAVQKGDAITQLNAYRSLVSDFKGLRDVSEDARKLAALKQSPVLKAELKKEDDQVAQQETLTAPIFASISQLGDASVDQRLAIRTDILDQMTGLKHRALRASSEDQRLVLLRAFNSLWVDGIESGQARLAKKDWDTAIRYFQLMSDVSPDEPWPCLLLAETRTAMGDKKLALGHLREAIRRGVKSPDVFDKDAALDPLRKDPGYQKIINELKERQ